MAFWRHFIVNFLLYFKVDLNPLSNEIEKLQYFTIIGYLRLLARSISDADTNSSRVLKGSRLIEYVFPSTVSIDF